VSELDHYDVERMIRDERHSIDQELERRVNQFELELRREIDTLRHLIEKLERVLQARTDHLV
jgi:hypothetical protein